MGVAEEKLFSKQQVESRVFQKKKLDKDFPNPVHFSHSTHDIQMSVGSRPQRRAQIGQNKVADKNVKHGD